jgi:glucose/arabinose dehydrogenase
MIPVAVAGPAIVPPEFEDVAVVSDFDGVSQFGWAPDGLLFLGSKSGIIRVWDGATLTSVGILPVDNWSERGLNGLAIDPDYLTNGHIWVYYANSNAGRNQVSRLTYNGMQLVDEVKMLEGPVLLNGNHSAGAIRFASDKTLYIAMGDDAQGR